MTDPMYDHWLEAPYQHDEIRAEDEAYWDSLLESEEVTP